MRYEEISELGAAIEVQVQWNCEVDLGKFSDSCEVEISAKRLDDVFNKINIGYGFNYAEYISETERVVQEVRGIRFFLRTYGTGSRISISGVILKGSTVTALLNLASILVDFVMLNFMRRKKRYHALKYVESDVQEYLTAVHHKLGKVSDTQQESTDDLDKHEEKQMKEEEEWLKRVEEEN